MSRTLYKYRIDRSVDWRELEQSLLLAVVAIESLHGESRVRLDARYCMRGKDGICVVDAGSQIGRDLNRIFTGFVTREFGEGSFRVEQITTDESPTDCAASAVEERTRGARR